MINGKNKKYNQLIEESVLGVIGDKGAYLPTSLPLDCRTIWCIY